MTVSGPPRLSWRSNSGISEPEEPSTLPKRTVMKRGGAAAAPIKVERLAVELGQPLGRAHDAGRVDRLVGRHLHHRERAVAAGGVGDVAGADDVGEHALARVELDHRHVLERGGMEDELRPMPGEHLHHAVALADVAQVRHAAVRRDAARQGQGRSGRG